MKYNLLLILGALLVSVSFSAISHSEDFTSIEGTYMLKSRELQDGTILTPPAVAGLYNIGGGYMSFNLAVKDNKGNIILRSALATYTISGSTYAVKLFFTAENDGTGIKYDFSKRSGSSEMMMSGGNVEMQIPLSDNIYGSFGPDSLTVMKSGEYIDKWVKVK